MADNHRRRLLTEVSSQQLENLVRSLDSLNIGNSNKEEDNNEQEDVRLFLSVTEKKTFLLNKPEKVRHTDHKKVVSLYFSAKQMD